MPASTQADEEPIDEQPLADEDPADFAVERFEFRPSLGNSAVDFLNVAAHRGTPWRLALMACIVPDCGAVDNGGRLFQHEGMKPMSMKKFCRIVSHVMETLPEEFAPYLDNVVVDVEEEPDEKTLRRAGFTDEEIADGETLLGFFDPLELPTQYSGDAVDPDTMLHRLVIYKRPLEEEYPNPRQLRIEIRKTVIHELAHHFGWTDRDLEQFDDNPNPFDRDDDSDESPQEHE
jgi:predicted Zn-dependent protease with MMP-like domain